MYQCRNFVRTTTSKWVVLICSINLCPDIEFALGQRNGGGLSLAWAANVSMANAFNLFRTVQKQKVAILDFQREIVMKLLASFGRNKPAKSLAFPGNVTSNVKLDTKNHILVKGTSNYCRCKHCGGRSIYLCQKCNVALHPACFKDYHS